MWKSSIHKDKAGRIYPAIYSTTFSVDEPIWISNLVFLPGSENEAERHARLLVLILSKCNHQHSILDSVVRVLLENGVWNPKAKDND